MNSVKMVDRQRHGKKIEVYTKAVEKIGFNKVGSVIGFSAAGKFELAKDAHCRQQAASIVADFLSDAQVHAERNCGAGFDEVTVYDILESL